MPGYPLVCSDGIVLVGLHRLRDSRAAQNVRERDVASRKHCFMSRSSRVFDARFAGHFRYNLHLLEMILPGCCDLRAELLVVHALDEGFGCGDCVVLEIETVLHQILDIELVA